MSWITGCGFVGLDCGALNSDEAPSQEQIDAYQAWLAETGADDSIIEGRSETSEEEETKGLEDRET